MVTHTHPDTQATNTHMKIDDNLSEIFDVEVYKENDVITSDGRVIPPDTNEGESDYQKARENLHTILEYGKNGLELSYKIATSTEEPKAIQVMTEMIRTLTETNMKLIEIHEKRARIKPKEPAEKSGQMVQNNQQNIFVGTTSDLGKFIKDIDNK